MRAAAPPAGARLAADRGRYLQHSPATRRLRWRPSALVALVGGCTPGASLLLLVVLVVLVVLLVVIVLLVLLLLLLIVLLLLLLLLIVLLLLLLLLLCGVVCHGRSPRRQLLVD